MTESCDITGWEMIFAMNYMALTQSILTSPTLGAFWSKILARQIAAFVECHDEHDSAGLGNGSELRNQTLRDHSELIDEIVSGPSMFRNLLESLVAS
jgi:hypothetical protein